MGIDHVAGELRVGIRRMMRSPGSSLVVITTLGLGIGVLTGFFGFADALLFKPLPYPEADRLITVTEVRGNRLLPHGSVSIESWRMLKEEAGSLDLIAAHERGFLRNVGVLDEVRVRLVTRVTPSFFELLGVAPLRGRVFTEEEASQAISLAVVSAGLAEAMGGAGAQVVGASLTVDGAPAEIIGVMPPGFGFPREMDVWLPLSTEAGEAEVTVGMLGRLGEGGDRISVQAALEVFSSRPTLGGEARRLILEEEIVRRVQVGMIPVLILAVGGVFLLMICSNVGAIFLARASGRRGELGVRVALGASRARLVTLLVADTALHALLGGIVGLVVAFWSIELLVRALGGNSPVWVRTEIDGRVLLFVIAVTSVSVLLVGLMPALEGARTDPVKRLRGAASTATASLRAMRLRNTLVAGQVAISVLLLSVGSLLAGTFLAISKIDFGGDLSPVTEVRVSLQTSMVEDASSRRLFERGALEALEILPGVEAASIVGDVRGFRASEADELTDDVTDLWGDMMVGAIPRGGASEPTLRRIGWRAVSPGYADVVGIEAIEGRFFDSNDRTGQTRVAVLSEAAAEHLWPNRSAVGERLQFGMPGVEPVEIVGVVGNIRSLDGWGSRDSEVTDQMTIYLPRSQAFASNTSYLVRSALTSRTLLPEIQQALAAYAPNQPISRVAPYLDQFRSILQPTATLAAIMVGLALAGLCLTAIGLFGLIAYRVSERTREIGIRLALGGTVQSVVGLLVRSGTRTSLVGLVIGLIATITTAPLVRTFLYGVSPFDPRVLLGVSLLLVAITGFATWLPARRAAGIDPMRAISTD